MIVTNTNAFSPGGDSFIEPTVYIVDDEQDMLHSLAHVFRCAGLHAEMFSSAAALIESVRHAIELDALFHESRCRLAERDAKLAGLTRRERAVMDEMLKGKTSKATARQLGVSVRTIEGHRAAVM